MLYIATDAAEKNWLKYILEEFRRINKAEFNIEVVDLKRAGGLEGVRVIYYVKDYIGGISIVNKSGVLPDNGITVVSKEVFLLNGTATDDTRFRVNYDLFWNAFTFLSRLEEYLAQKKGKKIKSYSFNHPRIDKDTFDTPIVNNIFNELESIVGRHFPDLIFGAKEKPQIELSHDVDYLNKTFQLRIKQAAINVNNSLRSFVRPQELLRGIGKTIKFLCLNAEYWCFDYWRDLESKYGKTSIFYVYANTKIKNIRNRFIDPSYDIIRNKKLQLKLRNLITDGFEIGLHGSYGSAVNEVLLAREKEILESILGVEVIKVRQHWLRYEENITPYIHNKLFESDSTVGWNDIIGFRAGCASRYRPYDHQKNKAFDFFEIPLVVMDSNIYYFGVQRHKEIIARTVGVFKKLFDYKTAHVSICWHQRVCSSDYDWVDTYKEILNYSYYQS